MLSLLVFNRVYRLEIQSAMFVFSTQLCELLPLQPSLCLVLPSYPIPCVNKYAVYCSVHAYTIQNVRGRVWIIG
jgi:hypothetical protein